MDVFHIFLAVMTGIAVIVFVALYFVKAGYGMFFDAKWGRPINNRMALFWYFSDRGYELVPLIFFIFFEIHYFQRAFIFPLLLKGKGRMPMGIMLMGITFNVLNACMQGGWIFYFAPSDLYTLEWLTSPQFIIGTVLFFAGMFTNIQSDHIIRHLRRPGDTGHYLPKGGMFRYVTSANYFGEIVEWIGFAILSWSLSGAVFAIWTFANLVPRANTIYHKYLGMFGDEVKKRRLKRVIPFIY